MRVMDLLPTAASVFALAGCAPPRTEFTGETIVHAATPICEMPAGGPIAAAPGGGMPAAPGEAPGEARHDVPDDARGSAGKPPPQLVGLPLVGSQIEVLGEIQFDPGSSVIKETTQNIGLLTTLAAAGKKYQQITKLRVEGHTDSDGDDASNQELSERRAQSVVAWLVKNGIESRRLAAVGCGERDPVESNTTSEGKQRNRRTEFDIEDIEGRRWNLATEPCAPNPSRRPATARVSQ